MYTEIPIDTLLLLLGFEPMLERVIDFGIKPTHYTHLMGEETFFFKNKSDKDKGWRNFGPDGWWYNTSELSDTLSWYVKNIDKNLPTVYKIQY